MLEVSRGKYIVVEPFIPMDLLKKTANTIQKFVDFMQNHYGVHVYFVPFDLVHFGNDQALFCQSLNSQSKTYDISKIKYPRFEDINKIISSSELVISARYHGFVLSLSKQIPTIHIINNSHGSDYGKTKGISILETCIGKELTAQNMSLFLSNNLFETMHNIQSNYSNIISEQKSLYESDTYMQNIKQAHIDRLQMINHLLKKR